MPAALTDSSEVVANYIYQKLLDPTNMSNLGLNDVWYGDQSITPRTPVAAIAPGPKRREFGGATFRTPVVMETYIMVYFAKIQDVQLNLHAAMTLAEQIEFLIHSDLRLGGNVISVLCTQNEPGAVNKMGAWMMGSRLTFESTSKTTLPQQEV